MLLCSKCQQKEATVHFITVMDSAEKTVHFCKDCASLGGIQGLDLKKIKALDITGKKCEFCGRDAVSGISGASGTIYWCSDCSEEYGRTIMEIFANERPDLIWRSKKSGSFFELVSDPEFRSWSQMVSKKALQIMEGRKRQD
jgi:hypothetical protein